MRLAGACDGPRDAGGAVASAVHELGEHQRFTGAPLFAVSVIMTIAAVFFGVFPL